jgi:hypothetical protein
MQTEKVKIPVGGEKKDMPMGGRRKLRMTKKKTVRRILRKMGLKMRGGMAALSPAVVGGDAMPYGGSAHPMGGKKKTRRVRKSRRSLFGLIKY